MSPDGRDDPERGDPRCRAGRIRGVIRGDTHEDHVGAEAGLQFFDLSHPWGHDAPLWPYFPDVKIERFHYMAKSGVLSQQITTFMHCTTHTDAPAHVVEGTRFMDEVPLELLLRLRRRRLDPEGEVGGGHRRGPGGRHPRDPPRRHRDRQHRLAPYWGDSRKYFVESPGTYEEAGAWLAEKGVKGFGIDCQALDHPLGTAIGPQPNGPLIDGVLEEYEAHTGRKAADDFPLWEPCHRHLLGNGIVGFENVGGEIDKVTGKRVTFAAFPWRWTKGDGCIVRLVAIVDPSGEYRLETGEA